MKLAKATEILNINLQEAGKRMPPDCQDAIKLAIEALIWRQHREQWNGTHEYPLLPGQTRE